QACGSIATRSTRPARGTRARRARRKGGRGAGVSPRRFLLPIEGAQEKAAREERQDEQQETDRRGTSEIEPAGHPIRIEGERLPRGAWSAFGNDEQDVEGLEEIDHAKQCGRCERAAQARDRHVPESREPAGAVERCCFERLAWQLCEGGAYRQDHEGRPLPR